jgi:GNAT superfamily N-acetyltransferase
VDARLFRQAAVTLAASLSDDPFYQAITVDCGVDTEARSRVLTQYFDYSLREAQRTGRCVLHADPTVGAAAWLLPRSPEIDAAERSAKAAYLARLLGDMGWDNYRRIIYFMAGRSESLVPKDAWYLTIIGVHPASQGRGIGAELLRPTLAEATRTGAHSFLETFRPRSLAFYERAGFARVAEFVEPTTRAPYVVMRRAP